ncbi:sensor histidine kinase [Polyangium jinanense]|uniref:histidine kinase n=1 Tax=Polyangium jinanense TaxID=2829994 RepID=A0A9X3XAH4_9BACT|nr:ATP-binding protein [Polyangium jinanense]MDC3956975.1 PAS domain-containing sensor histidine kinase [Polyangium jinanense]MDC3987132.1 PAS domain-containing sensor histidine kinase [Polyangium jinanense]
MTTDLIARSGAAGALISRLEWSKTPLGPLSDWPPRVRVLIETALPSGIPLCVLLGTDPAHARVVYNDAFSALLGHKHPSAMGRPAREVWPESWDFFEWALRQVWYAGQPVTGKDLMLLLDRGNDLEEVYVSISFSPIRDDQGAVCGALMCGIETTGSVLAARRERALRLLTEALRPAKTEDDFYRIMPKALSYTLKDVLFAFLYEFDPAGTRATLRASAGLAAEVPEALREIVLSPGCPWEMACVARENQMRLVPVSGLGLCVMNALAGPTHAAVLPVTGGSPSGRAGVLVVGLRPARALDDDYGAFVHRVAREISVALADIQSRRAAEFHAAAVAESRLKDMFLGIASHELRTPLTCLKLNVQLVHRELQALEPRLAERLERLTRSIDRMTRLVNEMLSVSAIAAGKLALRETHCDLRAICRSAGAEQSQVARRPLSLHLPEEPVHVLADEDRTAEVITNLLANAYKYSAAEEPVDLSLEQSGAEAIVTVKDRGPGIPRDSLPHVFDRFYRVPGVSVRTGSYVGLGLGLYLSKAIVEQHHGRIWVESEVGRGSAFSFSMPLAA